MNGVALMQARALARAVAGDTCCVCETVVRDQDGATVEERELPHADGCPVAEIAAALARLREEAA